MTRNASWKHGQERKIDLPSMTISVFLWLLFFNLLKSNEEEDFRKATQLYKNTVGVNCRHMTHRTKGEPRSNISLKCSFAGCHFRGIGLAVGNECCFSGVLFRGFPLWISLVSRGFQCLRWSEKLKWFLSSPVFMGSFSSYELFIIPRLDGVIYNSWFSNSKYSLFIFF